jgi:RNA polymerase sigma factor (sigma-70 family)
MTCALPSELVRLLDAPPEGRDAAWVAFLGVYNPVLLRASRSLGPEHDGVMDRYAHVLEGLRGDDFRRLRLCTATPPSDFTLWLAVVARRLSLDHYRARYGRAGRSRTAESSARRSTRRRVEDLLGSSELDQLFDEATLAPDEAVVRAEERQALDDALAAQDPRDRLLLPYRFDENCSASEISRLMAFPTVFHVYRRINAVLAGLRRALEGRGIESR